MTTGKIAPINALSAYLIALIGFLVCAFHVIGSLPFFGTVNDLPQYYAAAQMIVHGQAAQVYNISAIFAAEKQYFPTLTRGIGLFIPPVSVFFLLPLALLTPTASIYVWIACTSLSLVVALWLLARQLRMNRYQLLWLVGLTLLSGPGIEALRVGQLAPFMLLALVGAWIVSERSLIVAGAVLDILVLKPQQFLPLLVFTGAAFRWRQLGASLIGIVVLFIAAHFVFGPIGLGNYVAVVTDPQNIELMQPELNPTVRGQLLRFLGLQSPLPGIIAGLLLAVALLVVALLGRRQRQSAHWWLIMMVAALPLGLCTSLHCHDYDLLLLVPSLAVLFRSRLWHGSSARLQLPVMLGLAPFLVPFYNDVHYAYLLRGGLFNIHFWLLLAFAILMLYYGFRRPELLELHD